MLIYSYQSHPEQDAFVVPLGHTHKPEQERKGESAPSTGPRPQPSVSPTDPAGAGIKAVGGHLAEATAFGPFLTALIARPTFHPLSAFALIFLFF